MKITDSTKVPVAVLAAMTGLSVRQCYRLTDLGVFRKSAKGRYDLGLCIASWGGYLAKEKTVGEFGEEKRLHVNAQRRMIELQIAEREGELASVAGFESAFAAAITIVSSQMDGLGGRMAAELASIAEPAVIRQRLFDECRRIRAAASERLGDYARDCSRAAGRSEHAQAPAE